MFSAITNILTWPFSSATTDNNADWKKWEAWQSMQLPLHFSTSNIYRFFLDAHPKYTPLSNSVIHQLNCRGYVYCFGDFANLIVDPHGNSDKIVEYMILLVNVYDSCKGYTRKIKGDPEGISMLKNIISTKDISAMEDHDFNQYHYDYTKIHAHTVAAYSLSTLIMRLVSNYMYRLEHYSKYQSIASNICQQAFEQCTFGIIDMQTSEENDGHVHPPIMNNYSMPSATSTYSIPSTSTYSIPSASTYSIPSTIHGYSSTGTYSIPSTIHGYSGTNTYSIPPSSSTYYGPMTPTTRSPAPIPHRIDTPYSACSSSTPDLSYTWPSYNTVSHLCNICNRYTEKVYGEFLSCFDCHNTKICSLCGTQNIAIKSTNGLPRCIKHL